MLRELLFYITTEIKAILLKIIYDFQKILLQLI